MTGYDHLMQDIRLSFTAQLPDTPASGGVYLLLYMGAGDEIRLEDGRDSLVVTPFISTEYEVLHTGFALGVAPPGGRPQHEQVVHGSVERRARLVSGSALAGEPGTDRGSGDGWRLSVGVIAGALAVDPRLEDYRWDVRPAVQTGVQATVLRGRLAAGARVWGSRTTQASGIPGAGESPRVSLTGVDAVGQFRLVRHRRG